VPRSDRRDPPRWVSAPGLAGPSRSAQPPPPDRSPLARLGVPDAAGCQQTPRDTLGSRHPPPGSRQPPPDVLGPQRRLPAAGSRPGRAAGAGARVRRPAAPALRHLGVVAAAVLLTVAGGVLSATTARTEPAEAVAAPPAGPEEPPAPPAPTTAAATTPAPPAPRRHPALIARSTDRLGPVVVDAEGYTLYRFDDDTGGDATCTDACVSTWLPVTVDPAARLRVEGVDDSAVGLIRRREGTYQLTVGGWPLYRFAGDTAPGRTGGHGIGGSWFAISPTGAKAATP